MMSWHDNDGLSEVGEYHDPELASAGNSMVLFSGGSKISDEDLLEKATLAMDSGATGLIFGRNMWQRPMEEALQVTERIKDLLSKYPS